MKKMKLITIAAIATMVLSGCSKLTQKNYDSLEMGMTQEQVEEIIGSADNCSETLGTRSCLWGSEEGTYVKVSFVAKRAVTFSHEGLK